MNGTEPFVRESDSHLTNFFVNTAALTTENNCQQWFTNKKNCLTDKKMLNVSESMSLSIVGSKKAQRTKENTILL